MKKKNKIIRIRLVPMLILFALIIFMPSKLSEKTEIMELATTETHALTSYIGTSEWYKDYDYELNEEDQTIILTKYFGEEEEEKVVVSGTAIIDGETYRTVIQGDVYSENDIITSIKFEEGISGKGSLNRLFAECVNLTSIDLNDFDTSNVTDMSEMFAGCFELEALDLSKFDTSNVTNMAGMFDMYSESSEMTTLDLSNFNTINVIDMSNMFANMSNLTSLNVSSFDTSNVTSMNAMFYGCLGLTSLNVSSFNTGKVTDMQEMFCECSGLTALDVNNFRTGNVIDMDYMFCGCSGLQALDLSDFNTSNVTSMHSMFKECSGLTNLNVSNFDTSNVLNIKYMFCDCSELTTLDLRSFDTRNVIDEGEGMFGNDDKLVTILVGKNWTLEVGSEVILHKTKLTINPNGGAWNNSSEIVVIEQNEGSFKSLDNPTPPAGYEVTFNVNGGNEISKMTSTKEFERWELSGDDGATEPHGNLNGSLYQFSNKGNDTVTARYKDVPIILPTATREGYTFKGWCTDSNLSNKAGDANETYTVTKETTLYAKWKENPQSDTITSNVYTINEEKRIINKVSTGEKVSKFKTKVTGANYKVTDKDGKELGNDAIIGTGCILKIGTKEYKIVVPGDLNGTGNIELNDLAQAQKVFLELIKNDELKSLATDLNENGRVELNDLAKLQKIFLGLV